MSSCAGTGKTQMVHSSHIPRFTAKTLNSTEPSPQCHHVLRDSGCFQRQTEMGQMLFLFSMKPLHSRETYTQLWGWGGGAVKTALALHRNINLSAPSPALSLQAVKPLASDFTALSLSFLVCKIGVNTEPTSLDCKGITL